MKRVTIKDIAAYAGVSFATVSRALDDRPEISDATKQRVRAACQALRYVPNIAARGLVLQSTHTIGLIVPDITNPYFSGIALAVETTARQQGYRLLLCNSMRDSTREAEVLGSLLEHQIDGLIASPVSTASQAQLEQMLGTTPRVYLGNNHNEACSYIVVDNKRGAYEGTRYLTTLGHRDIVFLGGRENSNTNRYRTAGFWKAIHETGVSGRTIVCPVGSDFSRRNYELTCDLLDSGSVPSAIFAYSDRIALGVLQAAEDRGLRIPEDLSLLGFDNISFSKLPRINLTTVSQHKYEIGNLAVTRLIEQISGDLVQHHDILEPELIIRATCRSTHAAKEVQA